MWDAGCGFKNEISKITGFPHSANYGLRDAEWKMIQTKTQSQYVKNKEIKHGFFGNLAKLMYPKSQEIKIFRKPFEIMKSLTK